MPVLYEGMAIEEVSAVETAAGQRQFSFVLANASALRDGIKVGDVVSYRGVDGAEPS